MSGWMSYLEENRERFLGDLMELLRIPSVSTKPSHAGEVRRAAQWMAARLQQAGIEGARVLDTGGQPVVYGEWLHAAGRPTILFYGHFDVQPPEPLELWTSPPFEPAVRDGRIYARGACDMKSNALLPILACEALLRTAGALPVNVKFLFEGEEEIGSPALPSFMEAHRDLLACDLAVSADAGQYREDQPAIEMGMRGVCGLQIDVRSANSDLHSGMMGGVAHNAIHALVQILGSMRSADGRILVQGFYDAVVPLSPEVRAEIARIPDDTAQQVQQAGLKAPFGEPGYAPRERAWVRPTLEVNGMWGGFTGEGVKTIIPCEAHAKITCRLVANQEPRQILERLRAHIIAHAPAEVDVTVTPVPGMADAYLMPSDHAGVAAAERVLTQLYGKAPYQMRMGASLPVTAMILKLLGVYTVSFGFSLPDEGAHAPDEFTRVQNFALGQRAFCMLLQELSAQAPLVR